MLEALHLGNAPAQTLFSAVKVRRAMDGELYDPADKRLDNLPPARRFADYDIAIDRDIVPEGVEVVEVL